MGRVTDGLTIFFLHYPRTLANLTLIILFSEMLKFSKIISFSNIIVKDNSEYLGLFYFLKRKFQNELIIRWKCVEMDKVLRSFKTHPTQRSVCNTITSSKGRCEASFHPSVLSSICSSVWSSICLVMVCLFRREYWKFSMLFTLP